MPPTSWPRPASRMFTTLLMAWRGMVNADSESVAQAQPLKDGWKNSGCPWTKKLTPERLVLPKP